MSWKYHRGVNYLMFAVGVIPAIVTPEHILNGDATSTDMSHTEWRYEKQEEERMCSTLNHMHPIWRVEVCGNWNTSSLHTLHLLAYINFEVQFIPRREQIKGMGCICVCCKNVLHKSNEARCHCWSFCCCACQLLKVLTQEANQHECSK